MLKLMIKKNIKTIFALFILFLVVLLTLIYTIYIEQIIQIGAIIIALLIPFVTIERQNIRNENLKHKDYQKCFRYISDIIFYSIKSIQEKKNYKEVLIRSKALNFYQKELTDMKIIYEGIPSKMASFLKISPGISSLTNTSVQYIFVHLWIRDNLLILLKIEHERRESIENITVELNDDDLNNIYNSQQNLINEKKSIFEILESIRKEFNLEWDAAILGFLKNKLK